MVRTGEEHVTGYIGQLGINAKWLLAGQYVGSVLPNLSLFFFFEREKSSNGFLKENLVIYFLSVIFQAE